jgi:cell division protein FtsW
LDCGWQQFNVARKKTTSGKRGIDRRLLILSFGLVVIGLIAVTDASAPLALRDFSDKYYFAKQQLTWAIVGVVLMVVLANIHYTIWKRVAVPLFFISIGLLVIVFVPSVGSKYLGARRWLIVSGISVQPSEIVKLSLAIYLAKVASQKMKALAYFVPVAIVAFLIMLEPDLGTTMVVAGMAFVQIFASGVSLFYFIAAAIAGGLLSILVIFTSEYRRDRLVTFFNQAYDPLGKSYHIKQILLALGSGGFWGVGLGQSRQKYLFLPETATDSIFAVIAEEVGFVGASVLIIVFIVFIFQALKVARSAPDKFSQVLSMGLVAWLGLQTAINIGSMVAIVPLTGVPLPFISYGGSSLVATLIAVGILLNISRYAKK